MVNQAAFNTVAVGTRGDRLYPPSSSRVHVVLTEIRMEMEAIIKRYLPEDPKAEFVLLDYGCGNMPYRPLFETRVGRYIGCDLPGNEQASCILQVFDRLPQETGAATVVLSTSVLEHVLDPMQYLGECRRVLRPDGLLVLTTHGAWRYHPDPLDLWRWTSAGLKHVVRQAGFKLIHFRGILGPAAAALQLWQDATLPRIPRFLQPLFIRFVQGRIRAADRACKAEERDADASVYCVVAQPNGVPRADGPHEGQTDGIR